MIFSFFLLSPWSGWRKALPPSASSPFFLRPSGRKTNAFLKIVNFKPSAENEFSFPLRLRGEAWDGRPREAKSKEKKMIKKTERN